MAVKIPSSEITPEGLYLSRRKFLAGMGTLAAGAALTLSGCGGKETPVPLPSGNATPEDISPDEITPYEDIISYNNFYEFSLSKEGIGKLAKDLRTSPWNVEVSGLVNKPQTFGVEDLLRMYPPEERIYRMRCVEGWSMVIPWDGFPLGKLLKEVEPKNNAMFVRLVTLLDPDQMIGQKGNALDWPYVEGLRMDEAMHDLTILASGIYGKPMLPQNGAPLRLVVPWKYGFKSIKSIVKIELTEEMPLNTWATTAPREYGFYANVNPDVDHPRWSQATERPIGDFSRRPTLLFNGYADEVAYLYSGMDLRKNF